MNLENMLSILRARWRIACAVFGVVFIGAALLTLIWPKQYAATASVVVDAKPDPVTGASGMANIAMEAYVTTQVDVIASQRVAQQVVKVAKLDKDPDLINKWQRKTNGVGDISVWLASFVLKKVVVDAGHGNAAHSSNVIDITVLWPDSKMAALLANTFAQVAIDTNIELKVEPAKQYSNWFMQRSRDLHAELEIKQRRLSDFQKEKGLVATDEKLDLENDRLNQLSTALVAIQGQRQDSQSRQRQATGGNNESLPEVLQSPMIATLKNALSDAEAKRTDAAGRLGRNHPDYQAAVAEVASLRARIADESAKIAASLDSTAHVNVRRESDLRAALEEQKKRVLELRHQHDEASVLQNDVQAVQAGLDAVNQRLTQSNLESQTQQTNMVLLTSASPPVEPASPKLALNLALALILGAGLAIATAFLMESRDPRVRADDELHSLGVPLLVKVGSMKIPPNTTALPRMV